jgi:hypothetical protein
MRRFLSAILGIALLAQTCASAGAAHPAKTTPQVPEAWREFVDWDRNRNLPFFETVKLVQQIRRSRPVKLIHFDLDETDPRLDTITSDFISDEALDIVRPAPGRVRIFVKATDRRRLAWFRSEYPDAEGSKYWAIRLQAHSSYFVWDPEAPERNPFVLKLEHQPRRGRLTENAWQNAKQAITQLPWKSLSRRREIGGISPTYPNPLALT